MKVLLDTNIVLDYLLKRKSFFESASIIFKWAFEGKIAGYISASAVTDIYYLIKRAKNHDCALSFINDLIQFIEVAGVDRQVIISALKSRISDFEDAVQNAAALNSSIESIVTRNLDDYKNSELYIFSPNQFIKHLQQ